MPTSIIVFLFVLVAAMYAAYKARKLTLTASLTGGGVGTAIFIGAHFAGIAMLATFFILAVLATAWGKRIKKRITTGGQHSEIRDAWQVLANGGVAAFFGVLIFLLPQYSSMFTVLMAASLSSATADTLSSELGTVYGHRFYDIISFKPGEKGRDGVISLEGTLIGVIGSAIIALIHLFALDGSKVWIIVIAGTAGNLFDSVLGATLERKGYLKNNMVNFLNTFFAALIACLLMLI
jgi:uncharacterized protein (TIGR00297 family)